MKCPRHEDWIDIALLLFNARSFVACFSLSSFNLYFKNFRYGSDCAGIIGPEMYGFPYSFMTEIVEFLWGFIVD